MFDKKLRQKIDEYGKDHEVEITLLDNSYFDKSIVGITEDGRLVYDFNKMVNEYMEDNKCSEEEAIEWLEYNTLRAIPYMPNPPIVIMETPETLKEKY